MGWARSQIKWPQESLAHYKLFNTLLTEPVGPVVEVLDEPSYSARPAQLSSYNRPARLPRMDTVVTAYVDY